MPIVPSPMRLALASARHPRRVAAVWAVVFALAAAASSNLPNVTNNAQRFVNEPESEQASRLLVERGLREDIPLQETVIVRHGDLTASDPAFQATVSRVVASLSAMPEQVRYALPSPAPEPPVVSADGHVQLLFVRLEGTIDESAVPAAPFVERIRSLDAAVAADGFDILTSGYASTEEFFAEEAEEDLGAEVQALPLAAIVLLVVFGTLVAALVPLVLALVAIVVAMGAAGLVGELSPLSIFVTNIILTIGLAVGIDYALFVVQRFREERLHADNMQAVTTAGDTAGRAVLFSGMTVIIALAGMYIVPVSIFRTMAIGAILVVVAAVAASLTLLPAILGLLGGRIDRLRLPYVGRRRPQRADEGFWAAVARLVMQYRYIAAALGAVLLLALAASYPRIHLGRAGVATLPPGNEAREAFQILDQHFSAGLSTPAEVVIDGDVSSPAVGSALDDLVRRLAADGERYGTPNPLRVAPSGDVALLQVPLRGDATSDGAVEAVRALREEHIPAAFADVDARVLVGGLTAGTADFFELVRDWTPIVIGFVLTLSFLLLLLVFRSLFVPFKAILMNLLGVGATYGLLVLVFQDGIGADLLGFQVVEEVEAWVPLFLFTIVFGLSMDYEVFLLSRMREHYDATGDNRESIAFGLHSTANIITGAAAIMVIVFAGFARGDLVMFQQLGLGLAAAVIFDATVIRVVLVPATMAMVGHWNWYLPAWLQWLPDLRVEGTRHAEDTSRAQETPSEAA